MEFNINCLLEYINFNDDLIEYNICVVTKIINTSLTKSWRNGFLICKFSNHNNNKFILLLQKKIYPYEYVDDWEKINETSLPEKERFYSHLNMEDITDADYAHKSLV